MPTLFEKNHRRRTAGKPWSTVTPASSPFSTSDPRRQCIYSSCRTNPFPPPTTIADEDESLIGHMFIVARATLARAQGIAKERVSVDHQLQCGRRVRRSTTCMCICSAGGRSDRWFREHKYPKKRRSDEKRKQGRAGSNQRATLRRSHPPSAPMAQKKTPGQRSKAGDTFRQGARHRRGASCIRAIEPFSAWLPARSRTFMRFTTKNAATRPGKPGRVPARRSRRRLRINARGSSSIRNTTAIVVFDQRGLRTQPPKREAWSRTPPGTWSPT